MKAFPNAQKGLPDGGSISIVRVAGGKRRIHATFGYTHPVERIWQVDICGNERNRVYGPDEDVELIAAIERDLETIKTRARLVRGAK